MPACAGMTGIGGAKISFFLFIFSWLGSFSTVNPG
jgi:hypothetical protein